MGTVTQGLLRGIIRAGMYLAFRPKVTYAEPEVMDSNQPVIFICNHMSHHDGALLASALHKKKPYFLIAKDWYDKKQFGVFLRAYGSVPVDREGMDTSWYDACRKLIEAGTSILIFPEGKTSKGEMHEFQPGYAVLADKTGAMVVECANAGEYHWFFGRRKRIAVGAGYTLECPKELRRSAYARQEAAQARERIKRRKAALEQEAAGKRREKAMPAEQAAFPIRQTETEAAAAVEEP